MMYKECVEVDESRSVLMCPETDTHSGNINMQNGINVDYEEISDL